MITPVEVIRPKASFRKPKQPTHPPILLRLMQFAFGTLGRVFPKLFANVAFSFFTKPSKRAKHKVSDPILEQAQVSEMLVGKNLIKIYEWGRGEKIILLAHGWESRGTALRSFVPKLLENGFRVIAFDAPAHGDSGGQRVDLVTYAEPIKAIYHKYKNVESVIAHSFGGAATAYAMVKLAPEISLKKFVMIGTPASFSYPVYNALDTMNAPPMVRKYFLQKIEKISGVKVEAMTFAKINTQLNIEKVLLIHDQQDEAVYFEEAEKNFASFKNAELQVTDGFGHFLLMKNQAVIDRVVDFVKHTHTHTSTHPPIP